MRVFHITVFIQCYLIEQNDSVPMAVVQYSCYSITVTLVKHNDRIGCLQFLTCHNRGRTD